jgi:hypothetical protein
MKKFVLYTTLTLIILASLFGYILYTEGVFEGKSTPTQKTLEPFMKCEAGKCAVGKCGKK